MNGDEQYPVENDVPTYFASVLTRQQYKGERKYGTPLKTFNGHSAISDTFEELVDAFQYLSQLQIELVEVCRCIVEWDNAPEHISEWAKVILKREFDMWGM